MRNFEDLQIAVAGTGNGSVELSRLSATFERKKKYLELILKMNITYLIGNGFDVNIGLKSRYADFYETYVNIHSDDEADVIKRFKTGINDYIKKESHKDDLKAIDWRDLEVALGQFTDQMDEKEAEILYLDVNDRLKEYLKEEFGNFDAEAFCSTLFIVS